MNELDSNWKHVDPDTGQTYLKIIDFPCDYADFSGESMWVIQITGHDNEGVGYIANEPAFSSLVYGDFIRYGGGTDDTKAHYVGRVHNAFDHPSSPEWMRKMEEAQDLAQAFTEKCKA